MRTPLSLVFAAALALIVAGCGFHLRGNMKNGGSLPYKTLHIALPDNSDVGLTLGRFVDSMGTTELVATPGEAEAVFQQLYDNREKSILSVNAQGLVREYQLRQRYGFRVVDSKGKVLVPPQEISLQRDISYDDSAVLAKGSEEALLWRDLQMDLVMQILRRITTIKPKATNPDDDQ